MEPEYGARYRFTQYHLRATSTVQFSGPQTGWILPSAEKILVNVTQMQDDQDIWEGEVEGDGEHGMFLCVSYYYAYIFATNIRLLSLHSRTRRMILAPLLFRLPHVLRTMARTIYHLRSLIAPEITSHQQLSTKSHCIIIITNRHKPTSAPIYSLAFHNLIQQVMLALRPRFDLIHFDATTNAPSSNGPVIIII